MIEPGRTQNTGRTKQNGFLVSLILAAVFINAMQDFNRLQEFTSGLTSWTASLLQGSGPASYASNWAREDRTCSQSASQKVRSSDESGWNEPGAAGQSLKIKRINRDISVTPAAAREIATMATKKARRNKLVLVTIKLPENYGRAIDSELKEETKQ